MQNHISCLILTTLIERRFKLVITIQMLSLDDKSFLKYNANYDKYLG